MHRGGNTVLIRFLTVLLSLGLAAGAARASLPFTVEAIATFNKPWSLVFLPDGRMLVTEKAGRLLLVTQNGDAEAVAGVPEVDYGGQGGL
ncbi:MAG: PQQ-dependent sugar dehydrogenase, partial [Halioglobus sp.]|nr:PQQ-dependent sugar dehydrogenase [Halioglobus sp.]